MCVCKYIYNNYLNKDNIIIVSLQQMGIQLDDSIKQISQFDTDLLVKCVAKGDHPDYSYMYYNK